MIENVVTYMHGEEMRLAGKIHRDARSQAIKSALLRTETLTVMVICTVLVALCALNLFWFPETWWVWMLLGVAGAGVIVLAGAQDRLLLRRLIGKRIEKRVDLTHVRIPELQANVGRAMFQHRMIAKLLGERDENVGDLLNRLDEWVLMMFEIAHDLDTVLAEPKLVRQYQQVLGDTRSMELLHDPLSAVANAGTMMSHDHREHELVIARDVVIRVRREFDLTLDHIVSVNTALRKARSMHMAREHIAQLQSTLDLQLIGLNEAQDAVYRLGYAYELALN
jgi:hypothetical protein